MSPKTTACKSKVCHAARRRISVRTQEGDANLLALRRARVASAGASAGAQARGHPSVGPAPLRVRPRQARRRTSERRQHEAGQVARARLQARSICGQQASRQCRGRKPPCTTCLCGAFGHGSSRRQAEHRWQGAGRARGASVWRRRAGAACRKARSLPPQCCAHAHTRARTPRGCAVPRRRANAAQEDVCGRAARWRRRRRRRACARCAAAREHGGRTHTTLALACATLPRAACLRRAAAARAHETHLAACSLAAGRTARRSAQRLRLWRRARRKGALGPLQREGRRCATRCNVAGGLEDCRATSAMLQPRAA